MKIVESLNKRDGKTALHMAATSKNPEICSILLEFNADVNIVCGGENERKATPLDVAIRRGNKSCARFAFIVNF